MVGVLTRDVFGGTALLTVNTRVKKLNNCIIIIPFYVKGFFQLDLCQWKVNLFSPDKNVSVSVETQHQPKTARLWTLYYYALHYFLEVSSVKTATL